MYSSYVAAISHQSHGDAIAHTSQVTSRARLVIRYRDVPSSSYKRDEVKQMSRERGSFLVAVSIALLAACGGPTAPHSPTFRASAASLGPATASVRASAIAPTPTVPTLSAAPSAITPPATSSPVVAVTSSPVAAGGTLCPVALDAEDLGTEFDKYGELDFGDTQNPNPGFVAGRQFSFAPRGTTEAFIATVSCYESIEDAQAVYDLVSSTLPERCPTGSVVVLPVQLGDASEAEFCPASDTPESHLSAFARLGEGTLSVELISAEDMTPDPATVTRLLEFATAFLLKAGR